MSVPQPKACWESPAEYLADPDLWKSQVHPDDRDRILAEIETSLTTLTPLVDELRMQSRAGTLLWFHAEARPVLDPVAGPFTSRESCWTSPTASGLRRRPWRQAVGYRTLVENVDLGITLIGSDYKIIMTNAGIGKIFGKQPRSLWANIVFQEFEKRDGICPHCPGVKAMASRQPMEVDAVGVHDDGTFHYAHVRTFPTFDSLGNVTGFIEVVDGLPAGVDRPRGPAGN